MIMALEVAQPIGEINEIDEKTATEATASALPDVEHVSKQRQSLSDLFTIVRHTYTLWRLMLTVCHASSVPVLHSFQMATKTTS